MAESPLPCLRLFPDPGFEEFAHLLGCFRATRLFKMPVGQYMVRGAVLKLLDAWRLHQIEKWKKNGQVDKISALSERLHKRHLNEFDRFKRKHPGDSRLKLMSERLGHTRVEEAAWAAISLSMKKPATGDESHGRAMGRGGD
jgi:hypothetical protein